MSDRAAAARDRFDRPELRPLWRALRHRLERATGPVARVTVGPLTPAERTAIAELFGWARLPGPIAHVQLAQLDRVLLDSPAGLDTRGVLEALGGPITDLAGARQTDLAEREALWAWLAAHPTVTAAPALTAWVSHVRSAGLVERSVPRTRELLETALRVLDALPADGSPLPAVATQLCGDPHALDTGRLPGLVLRALAYLRDEPWTGAAEQRRLLWAEAGVACDALSVTVLTAGLRLPGEDPLATTLRTWTAAGHAARVTLAQLRAHPLRALPPEPGTVHVVENPSVVAAALDRFGLACPPLVCTSGWPNTAVIELLRQLRGAGAALAYHGDFDGDGLRIAAYVLSKTGATPWRMAAADYLAAAGPPAASPGPPAPAGPSAGRVTDVPWDPALGDALRDRGVAVYEEQVTGLLLDDLA